MVTAQTTASFLRTGQLQYPTATQARHELFLHQWGSQGALSRAVNHIRAMGFSKLMAYDIAIQFIKQCDERPFGEVIS